MDLEGDNMCTAIAKKGNDLIYGFSLDINPAEWNFDLYKTESCFTVVIKTGNTLYFTHGVNKNGNFGNVPYMNGQPFNAPGGAEKAQIDLLTDGYIRGRYTYGDIERIVCTKTVVSPPAVTMHSLFGSGNGDFLIVEPGYGYQKVKDSFAVIANFPVLTVLGDYSNPFYGKDRYDKAFSILNKSGNDFSVTDALHLLNEVKQGGPWGTRVSFVYSGNENAVYYFLNGDASEIRIHRFE